MTFKKILLATATLAMISGAAMAQSTTGNGAASGSTPPGAVLMDDTKMKPFFTDADMKMARTGDEFKKAFMAMSPEDQTMAKEECKNSNSPRASFCESMKAMN